ncbi:MAG: leucyl aminopeptidase [Acidobacteria bacterium]|nr:leucyl aminopeptidase [Acidobacteriota bacterium]MBV9474799.1 leucyl aminopeptidase [Acidobacteriota bacterium]
MQVDISRVPNLAKFDHLFVLLAEGAAEVELAEARDAIARAKFEGRGDESITILADGPRKITLIGLGKRESLTLRGVRAALTSVGRIAKKQRDKKVAVLFPELLPQLDAEESLVAAADMLGQSDYKYDPYITVRKEQKRTPIAATLLAPASIEPKRLRALTTRLKAVYDGVTTTRDVSNAPCNVMTPEALADRAVEVAKETGIKCTVYGKREIERMKMGGLLAVNRGSVLPPRFVVMEHAPRGAKTHVALVGKGITFDSGGISIKPSEKMEEMKFDMCGAAAVIGIMEAAAKLALPVKLTGIFAATENLPSGSAYKPGEIITMMNGKTVEIVNTDAEGRMILGDALHYASKLKPDHILDYATLTGACVVALGSETAGLFSNNDELARKLIESGERVGDRVWRLPAWSEYKEGIRSEWADMKNTGGRWGGAITAAVFLEEFVDCPSWAHLDIAGTAYAESETAREARGATGAGVRVTIEFLQSLSRR